MSFTATFWLFFCVTLLAGTLIGLALALHWIGK
jgi:hypothetical protein